MTPEASYHRRRIGGLLASGRLPWDYTEGKMRKTIEEKRERIINVCDLCDKTITMGVETCWLCRRECCFKCSKLMFCGHGDDLIEFAIKVCVECLKHEQLVDKVQSIVDGANRQLREWVDRWKAAVKR